MLKLSKTICAAAIERYGPTPLAAEFCRGLYPTIVASIFEELSGINPFECALPQTLKSTARRFALSQWYFDEQTIRKIEQDFYVSKRRTLCLGVPSLAGDLFTQSTLIDLDAGNIAGGIVADINKLDGTEFSAHFQLCVADPPWYLSDYLRWIKLARNYIARGSIVIMPLLGELTRPSAETDRNKIIEFAESIGFNSKVLRDFCRYQTPKFELAMLCRDGIYAPNWKRADLLVLTAETNHTNIPLKPGPSRKLSSNVNLDGIDFEIIHAGEHVPGGKLLSKPSGPNSHIMQSPSARDSCTSSANVFTSNGFRMHSEDTVGLVNRLRSVEGINELIEKEPSISAIVQDVRDDHERWFSRQDVSHQ